MLRIILVRPGTTDFDRQGRIKGTLDIPLNPQGAEEAARVAAELLDEHVEAVCTAPGLASRETASVIARTLGLKAKRVDRLRNLDLGLWQGKLIEEVKKKQPKIYRRWQEHPETVCPPEGEMIGDAMRRVRSALDKLLRKHRSGTVVLVVSEPLARLVRCQLTDEQLGDLWQAECECGSWEAIAVQTEKLVAG